MLDFLFIVKLFGLVSCYTWRPYIKKYTSGSFTREESIVFENTVNYLLMLFYIYFISKKFKLLSLVNKINTKNVAIRIGSSSINTLSMILFNDLVNSYDIVFLMPNIQSTILIYSPFIGYYVFQEQVTRDKKIGVFFIVLGNLWINVSEYYNNDKKRVQ